MPNKQFRVVFLCVGNSCRSQMGEGWTNTVWNKNNSIDEEIYVSSFSAGTNISAAVDSNAILCMKELDIDISENQPKTLTDLVKNWKNTSKNGPNDIHIDCIVTVCDEAKEACPRIASHAFQMSKSSVLPVNVGCFVHIPFDDPPALVREQNLKNTAIIEQYRRVRDEIGAFVKGDLCRILLKMSNDQPVKHISIKSKDKEESICIERGGQIFVKI